MRSLTLFLVLLASALFAQTQQDIYRQALEAEEAGDVSKSIELFEKARDAGAAGCQHGVDDEDLALRQILGHLAVVFFRFEGFFVSCQADVTDRFRPL